MSTSIDKLREACLKRGVNGIRQISRMFKVYDDNGNRMLECDELEKGIHDYGLTMSPEEIQKLFAELDKDGSGSISFDEFLLHLRPPMSASRLALIDLAFKKMDVTGDGQITVDDLKHTYDVKHHPKYQTGQWSKEKILQDFLNQFQQGIPDEVVTKEEFLNYYAGVSASVDQDVYFDYMMRQAWKL